MKYFLSIDGTTVIKTVLFNRNFKQIMNYNIHNPVITNDGRSELNFELFWQLTAKCINL